MSIQTLIDLPQNIKRGALVRIRVSISHLMETGYRRSSEGERLSRNIIKRFSCMLNGASIFSADLYPAVSANPYFSFQHRAARSGELTFLWEGDGGFKHEERVFMSVQ
jgi:sulfur-oxidizing protein SoxZ